MPGLISGDGKRQTFDCHGEFSGESTLEAVCTNPMRRLPSVLCAASRSFAEERKSENGQISAATKLNRV